MADNTAIEWADATFNCWIGCSKVAGHPGCAHCYAEADMDLRRHRVHWGPHGTRSRTSDAYWKQPLKWDRQAKAVGVRKRVFCASLADVFEDWQGPIHGDSRPEVSSSSVAAAADSRGRPPASVACGVGDLRLLTMDDLRRDLFALIDRTPNLIWQVLTKRPENVRRMWMQNAIGRRCRVCWPATARTSGS